MKRTVTFTKRLGLLPATAAVWGFAVADAEKPSLPKSYDNDILFPHNEIIHDLGTRYLQFPSTDHPVRLYLIDTGISHQPEWFSRNPKLTFESSYPAGNPTATLHGTRMLDIIAGPESGAVSGTPIQLVSMNVYLSDSASTTSGLVADAIFEAIDRQEANQGPPAVICLASGSHPDESSAILESAIDQAVENGITVIVSAGNSGRDASHFIPSRFGIKDGVVCVGAYRSDFQPLPMSNFGPAVDTVAPGESVRTLALPDPSPGLHRGMTGTSPAAALATAAAIYQLSKNPLLTPAEVENIMDPDGCPDGVKATPP